MSVLSYLSPKFIEYIDKHDIKLQSYESENGRGFWSILHKTEETFIAKISYSKQNILHVYWVWCTMDIEKINKTIQHISHLVMLYVLFIYFQPGMTVHCKEFDSKLFSDIKDNLGDTIGLFDCSLCKNKANCLLCECKKDKIDIMNMITTMYDTKEDLLCFDDRLPEISSKFRQLYRNFINELYFSYKFVRNYMDRHRYKIHSQDLLEPDGINGIITLIKNKESKDKNKDNKTIGIIEFNVKNKLLVDISIKVCKQIQHVRIIILHLLCVYQRHTIVLYLPKRYKKLVSLCKEIGLSYCLL